MKLLKQTTIKGKVWTIQKVKKLVDDDGLPCCGLTLWPDRKILIDSSLRGVELQQTFLHEYIHACIFELHIVQISEDVEDILSDGLASILVDNFRLTWRNNESTGNSNK